MMFRITFQILMRSEKLSMFIRFFLVFTTMLRVLEWLESWFIHKSNKKCHFMIMILTTIMFILIRITIILTRANWFISQFTRKLTMTTIN